MACVLQKQVRMKRRPSISCLWSLILLLVFGIGAASAAEKSGVTMPDEMTVAGKTLVLNGMGGP